MRLQEGSPVSDDGRGLKQNITSEITIAGAGSPVSDDGRGLKHASGWAGLTVLRVRPSAMTGAD